MSSTLPPRSVLLSVAMAVLGLLGGSGNVKADILIDWNNQELTQIRTTSMDPLYASRDLTILQIAMFDAINGVKSHATFDSPRDQMWRGEQGAH